MGSISEAYLRRIDGHPRSSSTHEALPGPRRRRSPAWCCRSRGACAVAASAGAGAAFLLFSSEKDEVMATPWQVIAAAERVMDQMDLSVESSDSSALDGVLIARTTTGERVRVSVSSEEKSTNVQCARLARRSGRGRILEAIRDRDSPWPDGLQGSGAPVAARQGEPLLARQLHLHRADGRLDPLDAARSDHGVHAGGVAHEERQRDHVGGRGASRRDLVDGGARAASRHRP